MRRESTITLFVLIAALGGCSSKPVMTPQLQKARQLYQKVDANETLQTRAPMAYLQASKIYTMSGKVKDAQEADHYAYLLEREVEVTRQKAREKQLKERIATLKAQIQQAKLDAKESEVALLKKQMEQAEAKVRELEALNAKETSRGLVLTLGDVLFESGKAQLLPGAKRTLQKLVTFLEENPERKVLVEGHTDNVGSATYNLDLSLRRAEAVRRALIDLGIAPERVLAQGYGEAYPVAPNDDEAGRQRNRRVEIVVLKEGMEPEKMHR